MGVCSAALLGPKYATIGSQEFFCGEVATSVTKNSALTVGGDEIEVAGYAAAMPQRLDVSH